MSIRRIKYAFICDNTHNEKVCLVQVSNRANTTMEHMQYYQNKIVYQKEGMYSLLKILKLPSIFNKKDCRMIISKLYAVASKEEVNYPVAMIERYYFSLAVNAMIENYVKKCMNDQNIAWTRKNNNECKTIINLLKEKRKKRLESEAMRKYDFKGDANKSKNEMSHEFVQKIASYDLSCNLP